jgi:hypothetical protein
MKNENDIRIKKDWKKPDIKKVEVAFGSATIPDGYYNQTS